MQKGALSGSHQILNERQYPEKDFCDRLSGRLQAGQLVWFNVFDYNRTVLV